MHRLLPKNTAVAVFAGVALIATLAGATPEKRTREEALAAAAAIIDTTGVTFDPNASVDQLLESAREMFINDSYRLSEMLYKSVLIRDPNNLSAMLELAVLYESRGQLQYARGLLTRALILSPRDQDIIDRNNRVVQALGKTMEDEVNDLLKARAFEQALPKLSVMLTTQPENAELHFKKARCHLELGHPEAALEDIDKALNLRRDDARYRDLRERAEELITRREIDRLTLRVKGALQRGTPGGEDDALEMLGKILELDPDNSWANAQFMTLTEGQGRDGKSPMMARVEKAWRSFLGAVQPALDWTTGTADSTGAGVEVLLYVLLALLVFNSPFTEMLARGFSPRHSLSGRLKDFTMKEILSLINTHHLTGMLRVKAAKRKGYVYFNRGEIYHCRSGRLTGREALQLLISASRSGYFVFTEGARVMDVTVETPLSLILMELPERQDQNTAKAMLKKQSRIKSLLDSSKP